MSKTSYSTTKKSTSNYLTMDLTKVNFNSNSYQYNYGSNAHGLVDIFGAPRVYMYAESFTANGDTSYEILTYIKSTFITTTKSMNVSKTASAYVSSSSELVINDAFST